LARSRFKPWPRGREFLLKRAAEAALKKIASRG
jgi:hypothetical protein